MPYNPVLAVVIPVYNEESSLVTLLEDWQAVFNATGERYKIILIDDGSKDRSLQLLKTLGENDPVLDVHTQPNAGHGPAILKGYRLAFSAEWVFQIDSDHQLDTISFPELWANREQFDLLIAERGSKNATAGRNRISAISRLFVRFLYGSRVEDVNSPYRLMRNGFLQEALKKIPVDSFAPNILLTGWFVRKKMRIFTGQVESRKDGFMRQSKVSSHIFRGALRSAWQTIIFRMRS